MSDSRRNEMCPHCQLSTTHRVVFEYRRWDKIPDSFGPELKARLADMADCDNAFAYRSYYVAVCESCCELIFYCGEPPLDEWDFFENKESVTPMWPRQHFPEISRVVPEEVNKYFLEAAAVRKRSLNLFVVSARKALEAICDDKTVPKGKLTNRLKQLAFATALPQVIEEMTDMLRVLGNIGAHADRDIGEDEAAAVWKFLHWVIEYLYIAPSELKELRENIGKLASASLPEEDSDRPVVSGNQSKVQ